MTDHPGLAQLADSVPDRGLGTAHPTGNIVQGLAGNALQLCQNFPVGVVYSNCHSAKTFIPETFVLRPPPNRTNVLSFAKVWRWIGNISYIERQVKPTTARTRCVIFRFSRQSQAPA